MKIADVIAHFEQRAEAADRLGRRQEECFTRGVVLGLQIAAGQAGGAPQRRMPGVPGRGGFRGEAGQAERGSGAVVRGR